MMRKTFIIIMTLFALLLYSCSKEDDGDYQSSDGEYQPSTEDVQPQPQEATRWECIWFGSYPANEVVSLPSTIITRSRHSIW